MTIFFLRSAVNIGIALFGNHWNGVNDPVSVTSCFLLVVILSKNTDVERT